MSSKQRIDGARSFLLHTHPYSETSLVLDVFSRDHGRLPILARGARRPRSALRGTLIGFQLLELGWFGGGEVKTLAKAEWCGGAPMLQGRCLLLGYYLNELLLKLLQREDAHPALFDSYEEAVRSLAGGAVDAPELRRFEKALLKEIGYGLTLHQDADGEPVMRDQRYRYFVERGLIAVDGAEGFTLSGKTLLDMDLDDYSDPQTLSESKLLMRQLVAHQLGDKPLQSRRVFVDLQEL